MSNGRNKNKYANIYIILIYLLVFQNFLQRYISVFQYTDEVLAIVGIIYFVVDRIRSGCKVKKNDLYLCILLVVLTIIGLYSNIMYEFQTINYALKDWLLIMKFFFVYLLARTISTKDNLENSSGVIYKNLKIIVIILSVFTILNYLLDLYPGEIRYGIMSNKLFFEHPTYLAAICIALIANIILFSKKINNIYIVICLVILISTLRFKAIATSLAIILLIYYIKISKKRISIFKLILIGIVAVLVAWSQIEYYFLDIEGSPRRVLTETSIIIANDYFPIGTGFGTYGSYTSGENYSEVYQLYGIDKTDGMTRGRTYYLSDNFWPMIIGQFGYLGTIIYALCLVILFKDIQNTYKLGINIYISKVIAFVYLIISSTAEATFVNPISIPLALIIGLEFDKKINMNRGKT